MQGAGVLPATVITVPFAMADAAEALRYKTLARSGSGATDSRSALSTRTGSESFATVDWLAATGSLG